jgi:hypothetical protein
MRRKTNRLTTFLESVGEAAWKRDNMRLKTLNITAQPKPEEGWVHRFRNFGEDVYLELRASCDVDIAEIDAAFDEFHISRIREEAVGVVGRAVAALNCEHHLDDSAFVGVSDARVSHQTVSIVLDAAMGERLREIAGRHPIWVVGSEINRAAVEELRGRKQPGELDVTTWSSEFELVTEQDWLGILGTLDMHHGVVASDPPMNKLSVYGAVVTPSVIAALREYGFEAVLPTASGLIALKEWRGLTSR